MLQFLVPVNEMMRVASNYSLNENQCSTYREMNLQSEYFSLRIPVCKEFSF